MRGFGKTDPRNGAVYPLPTAQNDKICDLQPDIFCTRDQDCVNACPLATRCGSDTCVEPPFATLPIPLGVCVKEGGEGFGQQAPQLTTPCTSDAHCTGDSDGYTICYRPYTCGSHTTQAACMAESFGCSYKESQNVCTGGWYPVTPNHHDEEAAKDSETFKDSNRAPTTFLNYERNDANIITLAEVNQYSEYIFDPATEAASFRMVGLRKDSRYLFRMSSYNYYGACARWTDETTCDGRLECYWVGTSGGSTAANPTVAASCRHNDRIDSICNGRKTKAHCIIKNQCRWTLSNACVLSGKGAW
jgi:hypothetical protein